MASPRRGKDTCYRLTMFLLVDIATAAAAWALVQADFMTAVPAGTDATVSVGVFQACVRQFGADHCDNIRGDGGLCSNLNYYSGIFYSYCEYLPYTTSAACLGAFLVVLATLSFMCFVCTSATKRFNKGLWSFVLWFALLLQLGAGGLVFWSRRKLSNRAYVLEKDPKFGQSFWRWVGSCGCVFLAALMACCRRPSPTRAAAARLGNRRDGDNQDTGYRAPLLDHVHASPPRQASLSLPRREEPPPPSHAHRQQHQQHPPQVQQAAPPQRRPSPANASRASAAPSSTGFVAVAMPLSAAATPAAASGASASASVSAAASPAVMPYAVPPQPVPAPAISSDVADLLQRMPTSGTPQAYQPPAVAVRAQVTPMGAPASSVPPPPPPPASAAFCGECGAAVVGGRCPYCSAS